MNITTVAPAQVSRAKRHHPDSRIDLPPGFDPRRQPIIALHFFGIGRVRSSKRRRQVVRAITRVDTLKADGCYSNARR